MPRILLLLALLSPPSFGEETLTTNVDPAAAALKAPIWREQCEKANDGRACGDLGALHVLGRGVARDDEKAFTYYEKACKFGQSLRCLRAGMFAANGKGVPVSLSQAAELFGAGCKLLDPESCVYYYALVNGTRVTMDGAMKPLDNHPAPDKQILVQVTSTLAVACTRGVANACGNLGGIYEDGTAVPANHGLALHYFERACELGEGDRCARAARYFANGVGAQKDLAKAETLARRSCELGHQFACPLAEKALHAMPIELKLPKGGAAVEAGPAAPAVVKSIPAMKNPPPFPAEPGVSWAIEPAMEELPSDGVDAEVKKLIEACNRGDARACGNAAAGFVDDSGKPSANAVLARRLYQKACALGRAVRCADLARFYAHGWGTSIDTAREAAALAKACKMGHKASCR